MIFSVNRWELPKRPMTLATIIQPSWYEYDALLLTSYIILSRSIPTQNGWCRIFKPKLGNSFRRPWQCKQQWTAEYYSATISCEGHFSDFSLGFSSSSRFRAYGFSLSTCRVVLINPYMFDAIWSLPGPCCNMLEWFINQQHVGSIACLHSPTHVSCSWDCNKPIDNSMFLCFTFINNRSWDEISTFGPCNRFALQHASKTLFNMDPKSQVKTSKRSFPSEKETIGGWRLEKWYIMMNHKKIGTLTAMKQLGGLRVGGTELILCCILEIAHTDLSDKLFDNCMFLPAGSLSLELQRFQPGSTPQALLRFSGCCPGTPTTNSHDVLSSWAIDMIVLGRRGIERQPGKHVEQKSLR